MKKYRITVNSQVFSIDNYDETKDKMIKLLEAGLWHMNLEEINEPDDRSIPKRLQPWVVFVALKGIVDNSQHYVRHRGSAMVYADKVPSNTFAKVPSSSFHSISSVMRGRELILPSTEVSFNSPSINSQHTTTTGSGIEGADGITVLSKISFYRPDYSCLKSIRPMRLWDIGDNEVFHDLLTD